MPYRLEVIRGEHGYFVHYPELPGCMTQVEDRDEIVPMAEEILSGWLEIAIEDGYDIPLPRRTESHSGKFLLRVRKALHRELSEEAEADGVSLNGYVAAILESRHGRPAPIRAPMVKEGRGSGPTT